MEKTIFKIGLPKKVKIQKDWRGGGEPGMFRVLES